VARITPDGQTTDYQLPIDTGKGITTGPDGNIWVTGFNHTLNRGVIGQLVLNDGGSGAGAAPAKSAPLAHAVRSAAVDAVFTSAQPDPLKPVVVNQQPAVAAVDAVFSTSRPEAVTVPTGPQLQVEAGNLSHLHQGDRAVTRDLAGLIDPLTDTL
jgi:hypothetical protein